MARSIRTRLTPRNAGFGAATGADNHAQLPGDDSLPVLDADQLHPRITSHGTRITRIDTKGGWGTTPPALLLCTASVSVTSLGPSHRRTTVRRETRTRAVVALVGTALMIAGVTAGARAQKLSPAEAATRLSGTWVLNRELTSGFRAPGRRGGGRGGNLRMAIAPAFAQRGGGGGHRPRRRELTCSPAERRRDGGHARAAAAGRSHHDQGHPGPGDVRRCARSAQLCARRKGGQGHRGRRRGQHEVAVGQGRPQAGVLDRPRAS